MPADRVPQRGEVWEFTHSPERFRERSRVRIDACGDDAVAFTYLRSGTTGGGELLAFLRVYRFTGIEAASLLAPDDDEAVPA